MNNRVIFPNVTLIKKTITERLLMALHEIYKNHPTYTYSDDELQSNILIYPAYAALDAPGKKPRMIVKTGGYAFALTDTLFHNMEADAKNDQGSVAGFSYKKMMSSSAIIEVEGYAEEESSDLADELAMLSTFACRGMFGQVGIAIRGAEVSNTELKDANQNIYLTRLSVGIDFAWGGVITNSAPPVLANTPSIEVDAQIGSGTPGIEVFLRSINQQQTL